MVHVGKTGNKLCPVAALTALPSNPWNNVWRVLSLQRWQPPHTSTVCRAIASDPEPGWLQPRTLCESQIQDRHSVHSSSVWNRRFDNSNPGSLGELSVSPLCKDPMGKIGKHLKISIDQSGTM